MSNEIPDPLMLPNPDAFGVGQELLSGTYGHLAGALNFLIAEGGAQTLVHQSWPEGNCRLSYPSTAWIAAASPWRVPLISADHGDLEVVVLAKGNGSVRISAEAGNLGPAIVVAAGSPTLYQTTAQMGAVDPDALGGNYDDLSLEIQAEEPNELTILAVTIAVTPLYSPLSTGEVAGCIPQGLTSIVAGRPLPACRGLEFIQSLEALMGRPRTLFSWAGLSPEVVAYDTSEGGEAREIMAPLLHRSMMLSHPGDHEELITAWVKAKGDPAEAREVRMGSRGRGYTLAAGTGTVWGVQPASHPLFYRWEDFLRAPGPRHPFYRLDMDPSVETSAEILSMTLWGRR